MEAQNNTQTNTQTDNEQLTKEHMRKYSNMKWVYHILKEVVFMEKELLKGEIRKCEKEIGELESALLAIMPKTDHGEVLCAKCGVMSMAPVPYVAGMKPDEDAYECEICGEEYHTTLREPNV